MTKQKISLQSINQPVQHKNNSPVWHAGKSKAVAFKKNKNKKSSRNHLYTTVITLLHVDDIICMQQ